MDYLLDTNVMAEIRKPRPDENVVRWISSIPPDNIYLSALVIGEIRRGTELLKRQDPIRAETYETWLESVLVEHRDRIVPLDAEACGEWGRLNATRPLPMISGLMAATAKVRDMTFVTRNTPDVEGTGTRLLDPFTES